jgi:hypothetical protein
MRSVENYPALNFIARHGTKAAGGLGIVVFGTVLALALPSWGWIAVPAGGLCDAITFLVCKSYAELVRLICDMLIPR